MADVDTEAQDLSLDEAEGNEPKEEELLRVLAILYNYCAHRHAAVGSLNY